VLVATLIPTSAFAADPEPEDAWLDETPFTTVSAGFDVQLGDFVLGWNAAIDPVTGALLLNWPVGAYLHRPWTPTATANDLGAPADVYAWRFPGTFADATQWIVGYPMSLWRRQSHNGGPVTSDRFGFFYFGFMFPRDEAWYPCSYPCKWKCNVLAIPQYTYVEMHSPAALTFVYTDRPAWGPAFWQAAHWPLFWPWENWAFDPVLGYINPYIIPVAQNVVDNPQDTVHPLELWIAEEVDGYAISIWENKVLGYIWRPTDLTVEYPMDWPYICGAPNYSTPPYGWY
jgi:hypothetical protein